MINISKLSTNTKKLKEICDHCRLTKKSQEGELRVKQYFDEMKLYVKNVPKDNNNLYRAVSDALYFTQSLYAVVKLNLVEFIETAPNQFSIITEAFAEMDINEYISGLRKGAIEPMFELLMLCEKFKKNLHLIYSECVQQKWEVKEKEVDMGFDSSIKLFLNLDGSFDSVYASTFIKNAGVCQSLLLEIFDNIFVEEEYEGDSPREQHYSTYKNVEFQAWKAADEEQKRQSKHNLSGKRVGKHRDNPANKTLDLSHDKINADFFDSLLEEENEQNESTFSGDNKEKKPSFDAERKQSGAMFNMENNTVHLNPQAKPFMINPANKISMPTMNPLSTFGFLQTQNPASMASPPPGFGSSNPYPHSKIDVQKMNLPVKNFVPSQNPTSQGTMFRNFEQRAPPRSKHVSDTFLNFRGIAPTANPKLDKSLDAKKRVPQPGKVMENAQGKRQHSKDSYSNSSSLNISHEASPSGKTSTPTNIVNQASEKNVENKPKASSGNDLESKPPIFIPNPDKLKAFGVALNSSSPSRRALSQTFMPNLGGLHLTNNHSVPPTFNGQQPGFAQIPQQTQQQNQQMFYPNMQAFIRTQPPTSTMSSTALPTGFQSNYAAPLQQPHHPPVTSMSSNNVSSAAAQLQGAVAGPRTIGRLKFFDENQNYGFFVKEDDGSDLFVHYDDLRKANMNKETLRKAKNGYVLKFVFTPMSYYGKYNLSKKAVDIELVSIEPVFGGVHGEVHLPEQALHL